MFNKTYSEVEAESLQLWRLQSWHLLEEYGQKPLLPPPLSVCTLMYMFLVWLYKACICRTRVAPAPSAEAEAGDDPLLDRFEETHRDAFMDKRKAEQENNTDERITRLDRALRLLRDGVADLQASTRRQEARLGQLLQSSTAEYVRPHEYPDR